MGWDGFKSPTWLVVSVLSFMLTWSPEKDLHLLKVSHVKRNSCLCCMNTHMLSHWVCVQWGSQQLPYQRPGSGVTESGSSCGKKERNNLFKSAPPTSRQPTNSNHCTAAGSGLLSLSHRSCLNLQYKSSSLQMILKLKSEEKHKSMYCIHTHMVLLLVTCGWRLGLMSCHS